MLAVPSRRGLVVVAIVAALAAPMSVVARLSQWSVNVCCCVSNCYMIITRIRILVDPSCYRPLMFANRRGDEESTIGNDPVVYLYISNTERVFIFANSTGGTKYKHSDL